MKVAEHCIGSRAIGESPVATGEHAHPPFGRYFENLRETILPASRHAAFQVPAFSPDGERFALGSHTGIRLVPWRALLG